MSDETRPAAAETNPAPEFEATDRIKELAAVSERIAKSGDDLAAKIDHLATVQDEIQRERSKMRPINEPEAKDVRSFDDVVQTKARDAEMSAIHELNDRAIKRRLVRAYKSGTLPLTPQGSVDVTRLGGASEWADIPEYRELSDLRAKAAGGIWETQTSSSGTEWVPTGFSRTAVDFYTVRADIPALFEQVTIPDGVGSFSIPVETTRGSADIESEVTGASANFLNTGIFSQAQSDTVDFAPKKHANGHAVSMEGVEDLVIDSIDRAVMNSQNTVRDGVAEAIINGQTASDIDLDDAPAASGLVAADGYSNAAGDNGLRLHCIVNTYTTSVGGNLDHADFLTGREAMSKFGARPNELVMICSPKAYIGLLADTNVLTVDKFGPSAVIVTGQLAAAGGVPVVMTSEFPEDMAATGIDAGTAATTGAVLVNRTRWFFASKRALETTLLPQPGMDIMNVISRARTHFSVAVTTEHSAHYFINVT